MPQPTIYCNNKAHDSLQPWATLSISLLLQAREDKLKGLSCYRLNSNLGESRTITCFIDLTDTGSNLKGYPWKKKHTHTHTQTNKKNLTYLQLLVWGAALFKTFDRETDDINQAFRSPYYTGSALCIFSPCFTHLCLPFIYVFLLHISCHPKVSHFTSLSFSNQNVSSGKVSVNNLWQISLDLHRHRQERILNVLLFWNSINDVYTLIF